MARKANKAAIRANLEAYAKWRDGIEKRVAALTVQAARPRLLRWADSVRASIEAGDLGPCVQALIRSVTRELEDWESGRYVGVTGPNGEGRLCA